MTSRERLLAAMRRDRPDRVPIHVRGVAAWDPEWVRTRDPSFAPLLAAVRESCDLVAGWSPESGHFFSACPEVRVETAVRDAGDWKLHETTLHAPAGPLTHVTQVHTGDYPSLTRKFWVRDREDLERYLSIPYVPLRPETRSFFELERRVGDRALVMVHLPDPIACVHDLLGSELLAVWSKEERAVVRGLLDGFGERLYDLARFLLDGGVRAVFGFTGQEYVGPGLHAPRDFHEFCTAAGAPIARLIHSRGCLVHVHCHGPLDAILEEFAAFGADCLHPIEPPPMGDMPLAEAKRRIGARVCLEGNLQIGDLYADTPERIREKTRRAIDDAAEGGGFILCPSASPYTKRLPPRALENYLAMIETGVEYGKG